MRFFQSLNRFLDRVWPPPTGDRSRKFPDFKLFLIALGGGLLLGLLLRDFPLLGYDWYTLFHRGAATSVYYPPWTELILRPLAELPWRQGLGFVNGITLATVALMTYQQSEEDNRWRIPAVFMAVFSLQTIVVLWLGHIDGPALLGLWALPWAAPLVMMKATFIGFATISRKSWFLAALAFGLISFLIWPDWPQALLSTLDFRNTHPSSAGWRTTGWLPVLAGLGMLLKSKRRDPFQNMAAGALLYPFILPYHHLVLVPILGRLRGWRLLAAWLAAWAMLVPPAFNRYHYLYFVFPFMLWWFISRANQDEDTWLGLTRRSP